MRLVLIADVGGLPDQVLQMLARLPTLQGVLAALAAGKLKLATLPTLVFTLSNTYGACRFCGVSTCCSRVIRSRFAKAAAVLLLCAPCTPRFALTCAPHPTALPHQV